MVLETIETMATRTAPTEVLDVTGWDPDDHHVLECATAAQFEFVVTTICRHWVASAGAPSSRRLRFYRRRACAVGAAGIPLLISTGPATLAGAVQVTDE